MDLYISKTIISGLLSVFSFAFMTYFGGAEALSLMEFMLLQNSCNVKVLFLNNNTHSVPVILIKIFSLSVLLPIYLNIISAAALSFSLSKRLI